MVGWVFRGRVDGGILKILKILPILIQTRSGGGQIYKRDKGEGVRLERG